MSKRILLTLFTLVLSLALAVPAMADAMKITVNGSTLPSDVSPEITNGALFLPCRALSEALGADVGWDVASRTATVQKNGKTLSVSPGKNTATMNGTEVTLDSPAYMAGNRMLVPGRLLEELLNVKISPKETDTVDVLYQETVGGVSPDELFVKANGELIKYDTCKFKGDFTTATSAGDKVIKGTMAMEGAYKKPDETYIKMTIALPQDAAPVPEGKPQSVVMEIYGKGAKMYQNTNGEGWKKLDIELPAQLLEQQKAGDPLKSLEQIREIGGIISAGTPAKLNGKDYYVLKVTIDPDKLLVYMKGLMSGVASSATGNMAGMDQEEFNKAIETALNAMKMRISYKLYINSADYLLEKMDLSENITMDLPEMKSVTSVNGSFDMYDLNLPVTMPEIPAE